MFGFVRKKTLNKSKAPIVRRNTFGKKKEKFNIVTFFLDIRINHSKRLLYSFLILLTIGIIAIFSSTINFSYLYSKDGNKYYYTLSQITWISVGSILLFFFYFVRIELIAKFWYIPYLICAGLLGYLVYSSFTSGGDSIDGATRWLRVGSFQFQPSDFAKLAFVIFVASFLSRMKDNYLDFKDYLKSNLLPFSAYFLVIVFLILLGRNLGTALVVGFIGLVCYGVSSVTHYQRIGFLILCSLTLVGGILFGVYESYRADRIAVWANYVKTGDTAIVESNGKLSRSGRSFQFDQVLTACGSGGFTGTGLGESLGKYYFVKTTAGDDSIICIIGEEMGFVFVTILIFTYLYLAFLCLSLAAKMSHKRLNLILLVGVASWIIFQMFVHIGANIGVIPLTGQTLPFISLGGSSIISLMGGIGIVLNISKQRNDEMPVY